MKAIVTGASRGIGKGIAISLAKLGYDVHITGRTESDLHEVKLAVEFYGVQCTSHVCDHLDMLSTIKVLESIEGIGFDIVVNNAWGGYERMVEDGIYTWEKKFWEQPDHRWTSMMDVGVRTAFLCSRHLSREMIRKKKGLIVNISFWAAQKYMQNVIYGTSKAAIDKMTHDMAEETREHGVAIVALYPGLVRTEAVMANASYFNLENSESPEFEGLVIASLAKDNLLTEKSGKVFTSAELAQEYGIQDIDGKKIRDERM